MPIILRGAAETFSAPSVAATAWELTCLAFGCEPVKIWYYIRDRDKLNTPLLLVSKRRPYMKANHMHISLVLHKSVIQVLTRFLNKKHKRRD